MVDIDIKGVPVKTLTEVVDKTRTKHRVIFFDSEFDVLDSFLVIRPIQLCQGPDLLWMFDMILSRYSPSVIHIDEGFYNQSAVNKIREYKSRIWINALGQPDNNFHNAGVDSAYLALAAGGVNMIQTDLPVILLKYLESNGFR